MWVQTRPNGVAKYKNNRIAKALHQQKTPNLAKG